MILYQIAAELRPLMDAADEAGGELTPADLDRLDQLLPDLTAKVEAVCKLVRTWEALAAARKAEAQRLQQGAGTLDANARRLKEYLRQCLDVAGLPRHETPLFKVWRQRSPASLRCVVDPAKLPAGFRRETVEPDFRAALDVWRDSGVVPDGFEAAEAAEHLRIR
jgi:hypothetical protein